MATTRKTKPAPIGTLIDDLFTLREEKRALEAKVKAVEEKMAVIDAQIVERLDEEKTDRAASRKATVFISETIVPNTVDWEEFMKKEVVKNGHIHLVERRPLAVACREIWMAGGSIKGLEPYTKRKLNVRSINEK